MARRPSLASQLKRAVGIKSRRNFSTQTKVKRALGIPSTPKSVAGWMRLGKRMTKTNATTSSSTPQGKGCGRGCGGCFAYVLLGVAALFVMAFLRLPTATTARTPRSEVISVTRAATLVTEIAMIPTSTSTLSPTVRATVRATQAAAAAASVMSTNTAIPVSAPVNTVSASNTPTSSATSTATPKRTPTQSPDTGSAEDYTATSNGNLRDCPQTTCNVIGTVAFGQRLTVIGTEEGATVKGSSTWLIVRRAGKPDAYLHISIARLGTPQPAPVVRNTVAPVAAAGANTSQPLATQQLVSTAPPAQTWNCSGNLYNCGDFSNRTQLMSYWNACPGDPSDLDGNDNDGIPCESIP